MITINKKITMQDIANAIGVSKVTVSKALGGKEGVGEELSTRIQQYARQHGYVPRTGNKPANTAASPLIGVLVSEVFFEQDEIFYGRLHKTLYNEAAANGDYLVLEKISAASQSKNRPPEITLQLKLKGLLVLGQMSRQYTEYLATLGIPLVLVDYYYPDYSEADYVVTNNLYSMYEAVNYLYAKGHREIGFLGNPAQTSSIQDRYLGYRKSLMEHQLPIVPEYELHERNSNGEPIDIILPQKMPTAFACNSDKAAVDLCKILIQSGYRVPEDVSVIGFDNIIYSALFMPSISTVNVNLLDMAKNSLSLLKRRIHNPDADYRCVICQTNIIDRESILDINQTP